MPRPIVTIIWGPTRIVAQRMSGFAWPVLYRSRRELHQARQKCLEFQRAGIAASLMRVDQERTAIRVYCLPRESPMAGDLGD